MDFPGCILTNFHIYFSLKLLKLNLIFFFRFSLWINQYCDIIQAYKLFISSIGVLLFRRFTWWLHMQDERFRHVLFSNTNLSLSSLIYSTFAPVYSKTAFQVKLRVVFEISGLTAQVSLHVSLIFQKIALANNTSFFLIEHRSYFKMVNLFFTTLAYVLINSLKSSGYDCFEVEK